MFEVGFSELLLIMALALIVLGPEKLPKLASQVGRWMGRARSMARQFRETLEEEVNLEETKSRTGTRSSGAAAQSTPTATTSEHAGSAAATAVAGGLAASEPAAGAPQLDAAGLSPMDPGYTGPYAGGYATTSDPDADTRHNDYPGAVYEEPSSDTSSAPDPHGHAAMNGPATAPAVAAATGLPPDEHRGQDMAVDMHDQRGT